MNGLHNNETLLNLRERLIAKPHTAPEAEFQKKVTPESISISISEHRVTICISAEFAPAIGDSKHRPSLQIRGDRMFLTKEAINKENVRRIGTRIDDGQTVQLSFEYSNKPDFVRFLARLHCGKSAVPIKWFAESVWEVYIDEANLCQRRRHTKTSVDKASTAPRAIVGVFPAGEEAEPETHEPERTDPVAEHAPAQPERPEAVVGAPADIGKLRDLLAEANRIKLAIGGDLQFSLDWAGLIHATLNLI